MKRTAHQINRGYIPNDKRDIIIKQKELDIQVICKEKHNKALQAKLSNGPDFEKLMNEYLQCKDKILNKYSMTESEFIRIIKGGKIYG
jgi:hypothetical protein